MIYLIPAFFAWQWLGYFAIVVKYPKPPPFDMWLIHLLLGPFSFLTIDYKSLGDK